MVLYSLVCRRHLGVEHQDGGDSSRTRTKVDLSICLTLCYFKCSFLKVSRTKIFKFLSLAISNQAGRAEDKHVLPRDESHCLQQPIRSRSLTAHERDHVSWEDVLDWYYEILISRHDLHTVCQVCKKTNRWYSFPLSILLLITDGVKEMSKTWLRVEQRA